MICVKKIKRGEMKVATVKMNPDLQEERDKIAFDIEEFTNWFYKGAEKVEEKRFLGIFVITCDRRFFELV